MVKIIFICHGNICRSPTAEYVMKDLAEKRNVADQMEIASAATSSEEIWGGVGNPVDLRAQEELNRHGIRCDGKRAMLLKPYDYEYYDYLIGMDQKNIRNIERITGHTGGKIHLLLEYTGEETAIPDPWYSGKFREAYREISRGCEAFMDHLISEHTVVP